MAHIERGCLERLRRAVRTVIFIVALIVSLLSSSLPVVLVSAGDVALPLIIISSLPKSDGRGFRLLVKNYSFRASLIDFPLVSGLRSIIILSIYSFSDISAISHGPYLGAVSFCSIVSVVLLSVKACIFTVSSPYFDTVAVATSILSASTSSSLDQKLHLRTYWGLPILLLSSIVFALGHVVVAYRSVCRARRKLIFHRVNTETVLSCRSFFSLHPKANKSPIPVAVRNMKIDSEMKKKNYGIVHDDNEVPARLLADSDSLFTCCNGLIVHYKVCLPSNSHQLPMPTFKILENSSRKANGRHKFERQGSDSLSMMHHTNLRRSYSNHFNGQSLYVPLLESSPPSPELLESSPLICSLEDQEICKFGSPRCQDSEEKTDVGIVLVHGFGGGVFSWRHLMSFLAQHTGCRVATYDRPGWGLTSRPRRKDWEDKELPNPYTLDSQVDLLLSFCSEMGFSSVVLIGHDDGGLIALKAAQRVQGSMKSYKVTVRGIVLLNVSLTREVVPSFARILLRTSLGKKNLVRPLLRTEIVQVVNRSAWHDNAKLTAETLKLYKAPLFVEGWDEAVHEIGKLSCETVLSPQLSADLFASLGEIPVLVVACAEDVIVPLKTCQAIASKFHVSKFATISGCGHLPHEECPKPLLAVMAPFIADLLRPTATVKTG